MQVIDYIISQRNAYETQSIDLPGGGEFSQSEMIERINKNWRSEYYEEQSDNIIGKYPYDNIVKPIILLEARATDFDVKHLEVEPIEHTREGRVSAMIATKALYNYARKHKTGKVFNDICFTRPKYGGVLVKNANDVVEVVPWETLITDQTDIPSGIIIERHYYTPAQLIKQKKIGWKNIEEAIDHAEAVRQADVNTGAKRNNTQSHLIEVFELHGEIPMAMYMDARDEEYEEPEEREFVQVMIVATASAGDNGEAEGLILYADTEEESPYLYGARNKQVSRGIGESVYETLREHQKWHNYSKTEEARMMSIAGKMLYITNQPDAMTNIFTGKVDHGTVLKLGTDANGNPNFFHQLNQIPNGTPVYQNMREEWANSARSVTSAHPAKLGEEAKAGTPFRAQYLQNVEASSQFEQYREEIGLDLIQPIAEKWLLPNAIKELLQEDELYASFTLQELELIDEVLIQREKNKKAIETLLSDKPVTQEILDMTAQDTTKELRRSGNKRVITDIKAFLKKIPTRVAIHVTDEQRNKAVLFESYANLLNVLDPADPRRNAVIDRIMDSIGVTKDELMMYEDKAMANQMGMPQVPGMPPVPQGAPGKADIKTEQLAQAMQAQANINPPTLK